MAGSKNNPPIIRGVYSFTAILFTLERISTTLSACQFLSEAFINDLLKSHLPDITDTTNFKSLAARLHEERKRLSVLQPDVAFLIAGVHHELEVAQIGRSQGWKTVEAMEVAEKISPSTRQRLSAVRPQLFED